VKISKTLILLLITFIWTGIYFYTKYLHDGNGYRGDYPYQVTDIGHSMILSGFMLIGTWIIFAIKERNIYIGTALIGLGVAFGFFVLANTENIGYTIEYFSSFDGGGCIIKLNPFLHIGSVIEERKLCVVAVEISSRSIRNILLYLFYGELLSFSFLKICLELRNFIKKGAHTSKFNL